MAAPATEATAMYLYRQSENRQWRIYWWDQKQTRSCSTGTTDRLAAERVLLAMREASEHNADERRIETLLRAAFAGRRRGLLLAAVADEYRAQTERSHHTRTAAGHWEAFASWAVAHRPGVHTLQDLDPAACRAYVASLRGKTPKTIANTIGDCARVYRVVAPLHGVSVDPWRGIRTPRATAKPARAVTREELEALLAHTTGEYHGAILAGAYTGLRYHDVARLRWDAIRGDVLMVRPEKTEKRGTAVQVPLHRRLQAYLAGLPRDGAFVFPGLAEGYARDGGRRQFAYARRRAGIPAGVTFHSLRHWFITQLAEAGVPQDVRMRLAGHSVAATHSQYTHDLQAQREAVDRLQ